MTSLEDRCKTALDETRTLMLGAQVLIGFQFDAVFQERFPHLPVLHQYLWLATLVGMLISLAVLLMPIPFDRVSDQGQPVERFEGFVTLVCAVGLLPIAISLGLDVFVAASAASVGRIAPVLGVLGTLMALFWWYGIGGWRRMQQPKRKPGPDDGSPADLKDRITNVLTEARTALPGAQALLGFQFVVVLTQAFAGLPAWLQQLHVASLMLTAITTLLLIAPAAYHRIGDDGEFTESTLRFGSRAVLASLAPLGLALCADLYVVTWVVAKSSAWAAGLSGGMLILFVLAWLVYPLLAAKRRPEPTEPRQPLTGVGDRPQVRSG